MEVGVSLQCSQEHLPGPDELNPYFSIMFKIHFNIIPNVDIGIRSEV
jgi:hypothetical protein